MGVDVVIAIVNWFNAASSRVSDAASRCSSPDLNPVMVPDKAARVSASLRSESLRRFSRLVMAVRRLASP